MRGLLQGAAPAPSRADTVPAPIPVPVLPLALAMALLSAFLLLPSTVAGQADAIDRGPVQGVALDLGVVLDGAFESSSQEENAFVLRKLEVLFSGAVDPYFDFESVIAFEEGGGAEVEEAHVTAVLPWRLLLRTGRDLLPFGYLNQIHPHDFPWADQPLGIEELTTDHGFYGDGAHLQWLSPLVNPTLSFTGGLYHSIEHSVGRRIQGRPYMLRVESFWQSGDMLHAVLVGASHLGGIGDRDHRRGGPEDIDARTFAQTQRVLGLDARYRWEDPDRTQAGWTVAAEFLRQTADVTRDPALAGEDELFDFQTGFGLTDRLTDQAVYGYVQRDRGPYWGYGYRFDHTDVLLSDGEAGIQAHSLYVQWRPTEFSRLTFQYQHRSDDRFPDTDHRFTLQGTFWMGYHPPHVF